MTNEHARQPMIPEVAPLVETDPVQSALRVTWSREVVPRLYPVARRAVRSLVAPQDRDDVVQETMEAAELKWTVLVELTPGHQSGWISYVVVYKAMDLWRASARYRRLAERVASCSLETAGLSSEAVTLDQLQLESVLDAILALSFSQREVVLLRARGFSLDDSAKALGIAPSTVKEHRKRADARLTLLSAHW